MDRLLVESIERDARAAPAAGSLVLGAPTGSGKSTQVPRWCADALGRALVIEPRRIACRSLARHAARLERTRLGDGVGYVVRHDERASAGTRITYATPGIALRMIEADALRRFPVVVLDEFHERSLELDLLLAALADGRGPRLVVMSATLDGDQRGRDPWP